VDVYDTRAQRERAGAVRARDEHRAALLRPYHQPRVRAGGCQWQL